MEFLLALTVLVWLAYWGALKNGFVSDDIEGIWNYNGEFRGWDYGNLTKFIFYRLFQKDPLRNHIFSVLLHNANVVLLYTFLLNYCPQNVALTASALFAIHPIGTQAVAWISARGYPLGLLWMLISLNILGLVGPLPALFQANPLIFALFTCGFMLTYFLGVHAQFAVMVTFAILFFLGYPFLSVLSGLISLVMGLDIVREVIKIRSKVFKEQNMSESTKFHHRRFVVAIKSLWYYTILCLFPKRLGLYHTYGYHYNEKLLKEDKMFWAGFILLVTMIYFAVTGPFIIQLGIIWYLAYLFIFLNWITVHQFVTERYCYIPNIGLCLITAFILQNQPLILVGIGGLMLMRTWVHLPTYEDEVPFYQSNIWNFPSSEVAFTNLGVVYVKRNLVGSAVDMWMIALKINPDYDVAHYNISSTMKSRGDFKNALEHLKKAIASPLCHFKELWSKELILLENEIKYITEVNAVGQQIAGLQRDPKNAQEAAKLMQRLQALQKIHERIGADKKNKINVIEQKEKELSTQLIVLKENKEAAAKPLDPNELIAQRNAEFCQIRSALAVLLTPQPNTTGGSPSIIATDGKDKESTIS